MKFQESKLHFIDWNAEVENLSKPTNVIIVNGKDCASKEALFLEFSKKLNFPDYFGNNWDAF